MRRGGYTGIFHYYICVWTFTCLRLLQEYFSWCYFFARHSFEEFQSSLQKLAHDMWHMFYQFLEYVQLEVMTTRTAFLKHRHSKSYYGEIKLVVCTSFQGIHLKPSRRWYSFWIIPSTFHRHYSTRIIIDHWSLSATTAWIIPLTPCSFVSSSLYPQHYYQWRI